MVAATGILLSACASVSMSAPSERINTESDSVLVQPNSESIPLETAQPKDDLTELKAETTEQEENIEEYDFCWPVPGNTFVSREAGKTLANASEHCGTDIVAPEGAEIVAMADVIVEEAGYDNETGYGNYVKITHEDGVSTVYAHMLKVNVSAEQQVKKGDVIGLVGSTGWSTGDHCHVEAWIDGQYYSLSEWFELER